MPALILGVEQAIADIRDQMLRPQFNAVLELVYAQNPDHTINLQRVPDNRYYISEAIEPLNPPAIFIVSDRTTHDLNWQNGAMQEHTIIVGCVVEDHEVQRIVKKSWRYAQAIVNVLHDKGTPNIRVLVESVDYGPTLVMQRAADLREFRKDIIVMCKVLHAEAMLLA